VKHFADPDCRANARATDWNTGAYTSAGTHAPALVNTDTHPERTGSSTNAHVDPAASEAHSDGDAGKDRQANADAGSHGTTSSEPHDCHRRPEDSPSAALVHAWI
jgi:hypothetical protein